MANIDGRVPAEGQDSGDIADPKTIYYGPSGKRFLVHPVIENKPLARSSVCCSKGDRRVTSDVRRLEEDKVAADRFEDDPEALLIGGTVGQTSHIHARFFTAVVILLVFIFLSLLVIGACYYLKK